MLQREDFYDINRRTLEAYFAGRSCSGKSQVLYVYPYLNTIVTKCPSAQVCRFLLTEYNVSGNILRRMVVKVYVLTMMYSRGLFASCKLHLSNDLSSDSLIYPCNRKYRIFDFESKIVDVIVKDGFPTDDLAKEIGFRFNHEADFIPKIISHTSNGYTEAIIDGFPVARSYEHVKEYSDKAINIWNEYIKPYRRSLAAHEYADMLNEKIDSLLKIGEARGKHIDEENIVHVVKMLAKRISSSREAIYVTLSHGDLQPGNIWVENKTGRIVIIDWESCGERSEWYDYATLYKSLRSPGKSIVFHPPFDLEKYTVILEDLIFRIGECVNLPHDYGEAAFHKYLDFIANILI